MTGTVTVREARAEDAPRIAALIAMGHSTRPMRAQEAEAEGRLPVYAEAFARVAASPANHLLVAEKDGVVVGTYQLTVMPGLAERGTTRGKLESVHVDPTLRGSGVGGVMIADALARAKALGVGLLELSSNKVRKDAHRFYERLGFSRSHEGFKMVLKD